MAKKKISELPAGSALNGTELVPIVQTGTTKRINAQDIANLGNASGVEGSGTINYLAKFSATSTIANSLLFDNGTSIGLGTATPSATYKLDIIGGIRATTIVKSGGTSSQYLMADGSTSTLTNPITGTGTTNYLPKFTGASALGNSQLFDNGTNVGIGTASPFGGAKLQIKTSTDINIAFQNGTLDATGVKINAYNDAASLNIPMELNGSILYFKTGETERMRITSAGNVGIGLTTPSEKLEVQNAAAGAKIKVSNSGGGYATLECSSNATSVAQLSFTNQLALMGGNVGIGTASPALPLHLYNSSAALAYFESTNANGAYVIWRNSGTSIGDVGSALGISGSNPASDFMIASRSGNMILGTSSAEKMRITSAGNVGIGTTSPSRLLNISGAGTDGTQLQINGTQDSAGIKLIPTTGDNWEIQANVSNQFFIYNRTDSAYRFMIADTGNVLIGTTTDAGYKLDVNGTARVKSSGYGVVATFHDTANSGFTFTADAFNGFNAINSNGQLLLNIDGSEKIRLTSSLASFTGNVNTGGNLLINNTSVSKKGYKFQSPSSNWSPQESGIFFTPADGVNAATTFSVELWDGNGNTTNALSIAPLGTATFSGRVNIGNPVAAAVAVASTHKVTISIGGVTYYLLATNV